MGKNRRAIPVENKFRRQWETIERADAVSFMEDLIIAILQGVFEFLIEIFFYTPFDFFPDWRRRKSNSIWERCIAWFIIGCSLACVSMLFLKRTWISHPTLRIVNLVTAPIISAFISQAIARRRIRRNENIVPRNHFWQAFWFTLGIVTVRFAYAARH
jgi:multisubunit Na+/H+ antiporter MnhG subunit